MHTYLRNKWGKNRKPDVSFLIKVTIFIQSVMESELNLLRAVQKQISDEEHPVFVAMEGAVVTLNKSAERKLKQNVIFKKPITIY